MRTIRSLDARPPEGFRTFSRVLSPLLPASVSLLAMAFASPAALRAQQSATPLNCNSLFTPGCTDSALQPGTSDPSNPAARGSSLPADQTQERSNTPVYIDQGGIAGRPPSAARTGLVPSPPDPVTDLQKLARSSTGEMLPIFGRDLFDGVPSTFAPGDQLAVPSDYIVGPQDELLVRLWGPETFNSQLTVDRSGSIYIPKIGAIHVAGLRFDELQKHIQEAASRVYRNFSLTVNLGNLRSIQVYVVGEARRPGAYTVSSFSTVLNALFASGGPNVRGSMRHIQIRRNGTTLPEFDLYDIVLRGDKSRDVRLEPGDTLFIPPVGPQVALAGSVRHPAVYELGKGSSLKDILDLAGGFSATGAPSTITLDRIDEANTRQTLTIPVNAPDLAMALRDGDVIFAAHISPGYAKTVTLRGNLANPGQFAWHSGMRLSEILPDRMALLTSNYWRERNRLGVPTPLFEPGDSADTPETNAGTASAREGTGSQVEQNSVLNRTASGSALGLTGQVGPAVGGVVAAQSNDDAKTATVQINRIQLPASPINWSYAVIERLDPKTLKNSLVPFNLGRLVQDHDATQDLELQPGDIVTILSQKDLPVSLDAQTKYIRLEGEFVSPGVYSSEPGETLADLIRKAGGFTPRAYLYGSSFLRESARIFQQQRLDEYITQLSADMERALAVGAVSSTTGVLNPEAATEQRNIVAQLRQLRATGRVILTFTPSSRGVDSIPAVQLENDDVFRVPSTPATISVIGAVHGQNIFLYDPKSTFANYLSLAGSTNRVADRKSAFIIRADGSILSREHANSVFSNRFDRSILYPGDSIVIPEKPIQPTTLRHLLDYSQILSSFGLAAAAINVVR